MKLRTCEPVVKSIVTDVYGYDFTERSAKDISNETSKSSVAAAINGKSINEAKIVKVGVVPSRV